MARICRDGMDCCGKIQKTLCWRSCNCCPAWHIYAWLQLGEGNKLVFSAHKRDFKGISNCPDCFFLEFCLWGRVGSFYRTSPVSAEIVGIKHTNLNNKLITGFTACCGKETLVMMIPHKLFFSVAMHIDHFSTTGLTNHLLPLTRFSDLLSVALGNLVLVFGSGSTAAAPFLLVWFSKQLWMGLH